MSPSWEHLGASWVHLGRQLAPRKFQEAPKTGPRPIQDALKSYETLPETRRPDATEDPGGVPPPQNLINLTNLSRASDHERSAERNPAERNSSGIPPGGILAEFSPLPNSPERNPAERNSAGRNYLSYGIPLSGIPLNGILVAFRPAEFYPPANSAERNPAERNSAGRNSLFYRIPPGCLLGPVVSRLPLRSSCRHPGP